MSNITLTKSDGLSLTLPADSIRAIISLAIAPTQPGRENARSVLVTDFRGMSVYLMSHTARDIADQHEQATAPKGALRLKKPKTWVVFQAGDDQSYFEEGTVVASEGVSYPLQDGGPKVDRLRLHWKRPDQQFGTDDVDLSPENLKAAGAVVSEKEAQS